MKKIYFLLLLILCSCGSNVTVSSSGCENLRLVSEGELKSDPKSFSFEHILWSGAFFEAATYRSFSHILEDHDIQCHEVEALNYSFVDKWQDLLVGFVPLMNRQTIRVRGIYR